jgi:hypothetical protein
MRVDLLRDEAAVSWCWPMAVEEAVFLPIFFPLLLFFDLVDDEASISSATWGPWQLAQAPCSGDGHFKARDARRHTFSRLRL